MSSVQEKAAEIRVWITILSETIPIANFDPQNDAPLQGFEIFHKETSKFETHETLKKLTKSWWWLIIEANDEPCIDAPALLKARWPCYR